MNNWIAIIPGAVLSDRMLPASAKVVYGAIASFTANGTKEAFPHQAQIAKRSGFSVRTISRLVEQLKESGYIIVHQRGRRLTNTYQVTTLGCHVTAKCDDIPAQGDDAGERSLSIKRILKRNSTSISEQAEALYDYYAKHVTPGPKSDTIRSITKLLPQYSFEELMGAVQAYAQTPKGHGDKQYRFAPNNFFGKKEYFKDFLMKHTEMIESKFPPKEPTPDEQKTRQKLIEAEQA